MDQERKYLVRLKSPGSRLMTQESFVRLKAPDPLVRLQSQGSGFVGPTRDSRLKTRDFVAA